MKRYIPGTNLVYIYQVYTTSVKNCTGIPVFYRLYTLTDLVYRIYRVCDGIYRYIPVQTNICQGVRIANVAVPPPARSAPLVSLSVSGGAGHHGPVGKGAGLTLSAVLLAGRGMGAWHGHLESCTPGQDQAKSFIPVCTGTYSTYLYRIVQE